MIKKGDKLKVKNPFCIISEGILPEFEIEKRKRDIYYNKIVEAVEDEEDIELCGCFVKISYISSEKGNPIKYEKIETKYLEKAFSKVKYKDVKTGEMKEGRLIGGPIKRGWDTLVKVQISGGSQGTILVDSKYVYPLFGEECSDEEFKVIMETMKDIHNKKDEMMKDNNQESIKNDIQDDKLRWDLLPLEEIEDIVRVYHAGAKKYGPNRWQNLEDGINRYRAASQRHMMEYLRGDKIDKETGCYHLACCAWNIIAMLYLDKHGKGIDIIKAKTDKFIENATLVHDGRYDYSNAVFIKNDEKVEIICKVHGSFMQTPHNHLRGAGCPKCRIDRNKRLVCGVGINDFYGKKTDRSYNVWQHLIKRCYSKNIKRPYKGCTVCDEWKLYSNFKKFYDDNCKNDTFHLDKDILVQGNKIYSPNTCLFVPEEINDSIKSEWSDNKSLPLGVTMTRYGKYRARCIINKGKKQTHLGVFDTEKEAFSIYKEYKLSRIKEMAERYFKLGDIDKRTYDAILKYKILPFKYGDTKNLEYK